MKTDNPYTTIVTAQVDEKKWSGKLERREVLVTMCIVYGLHCILMNTDIPATTLTATSDVHVESMRCHVCSEYTYKGEKLTMWKALALAELYTIVTVRDSDTCL